MAWSAEKFKLEEDEDEDNNDDEDGNDEDNDDQDEDHHRDPPPPPPPAPAATTSGTSTTATSSARSYVLAVCLADGSVVLLRSFDDVSPVTICTGLKPPLHAEWSNSRKLLAVAGIKESAEHQLYSHHYAPPGLEYTNLLKFYSDAGALIYTIAVPYTQVGAPFWL